MGALLSWFTDSPAGFGRESGGGAKALGDVGAAIVVRREGESIDALESVVDRLLGSHELSEIGQMASSVTEGNGVESVLEKMMLCSEEH